MMRSVGSKDPNGGAWRARGYKMMQKPVVKAAVQKALDERAKRTGLTADHVLEGIARIAQAAEADADWNAALRGHELLGKHLKLFTDKVEHSGGVTITATPADAAL
jgi:phage terminase small subunit